MLQDDIHRLGQEKRKNCPVNHSGLPGTWVAAAERMGGAGEGVTALYSGLLLSCRVGMLVGGGGMSGVGRLCNSVTNICLVMRGNPTWIRKRLHGQIVVQGTLKKYIKTNIERNEIHMFTTTAFYTLRTPWRHVGSQAVYLSMIELIGHIVKLPLCFHVQTHHRLNVFISSQWFMLGGWMHCHTPTHTQSRKMAILTRCFLPLFSLRAV